MNEATLNETLNELFEAPPGSPEEVLALFAGVPRKRVVRALLGAAQVRVNLENWQQVAMLLASGTLDTEAEATLRGWCGDVAVRPAVRACAGTVLVQRAGGRGLQGFGLEGIEAALLGLFLVGDEEALLQSFRHLASDPGIAAMAAVMCEPWRRVSTLGPEVWSKVGVSSAQLKALLQQLSSLPVGLLAEIMPPGFSNPLAGVELGRLVRAQVGAADGQSAFVLLIEFAGPRGTTTVVALAIRASEGLRDGTVAVGCDEVEAALLRGRFGEKLPPFVELPPEEAVGLVNEALLRHGVVSDELAAAVRLLRPHLPGTKPVEVLPGGPVDRSRALELITHEGRGEGWFLSSAELTVRPAKLATTPLREVPDLVFGNPLGPRLAAMARHMARYWTWAGQPEVAAGFARMATDAAADVGSSAALAAVVQRTVETYR